MVAVVGDGETPQRASAVEEVDDEFLIEAAIGGDQFQSAQVAAPTEVGADRPAFQNVAQPFAAAQLLQAAIGAGGANGHPGKAAVGVAGDAVVLRALKGGQIAEAVEHVQIVVPPDLEGEVPKHLFGGQQPQIAPDAPGFLAVECLARGAALHIAVFGDVEGRQLGQRSFAQGQVGAGAPEPAAEVAAPRFQEEAPLFAGLPHMHQHGAAGGVAPEQGALGTAHHFHPLHIEEGEVVAVLPGDVDVVHVGADGRVEGGDGFRVAQTAQVVAIGGAEAGVVEAGQVRDVVNDVQRLVDLPGAERLLIQNREGQRHILQGLLPPLSGDHHFLDLREGRRGGQAQAKNHVQECKQIAGRGFHHDC